MENTEEKVLLEMRERWRLIIEGNGGYCACCDRWGKIYCRALNSSMARALLWLVNAVPRGDGWVHVPSSAPPWLLRTQQWTALWMWNLAVGLRRAQNGSKLTTSGMWRPTRLGILFAADAASVKRNVYVYNNTVLDRDGDEISIRDALGDKFSYEQIMMNYNGTPSLWDENWRETFNDSDSDGYDS